MVMYYRVTVPLVVFGAIAVIAAIGLLSISMGPTHEETLPLYSTSLTYDFNVREKLQEADRMENSTSPYWWLDSGGRLIMTGDEGMTIQGALPILDHWRLVYAVSNPRDTDGGFHPQNIFRLVTKSRWNNVREEVFFRIMSDNFSESNNRNESNGVLLMSRYQDGKKNGQTLYYGGVRVDGTAVIKKKYDGIYYTMAQRVIFPGHYERKEKINLLPHHAWIGLRMDTITENDGRVSVRLYIMEYGVWEEILSAKDDDTTFNGTPVIPEGHLGIRTDFMDVQFQNFYAEQI
jgi:hypothetical protein